MEETAEEEAAEEARKKEAEKGRNRLSNHAAKGAHPAVRPFCSVALCLSPIGSGRHRVNENQNPTVMAPEIE